MFVAFLQAFAHLKQLQGLWFFTDQQVAYVGGQTIQEQVFVEPFLQDFVKEQHHPRPVFGQYVVDGAEEVVVVENVEVLDDGFIGNGFAGEAYDAVKNGQGVAQGTVSFLGDDVQGVALSGNTFLPANILQVLDNVLRLNALEVEDLAAGQNGRDDLVLLRSRQDENGVGWGFLQRLQKGIEGGLTEHVDLINDKDLILTLLRLKPNLLRQCPDVVNGVVTRRI